MRSLIERFPCKSYGIASRVIKGEAVIVIPQEGAAIILNETGSRIWELLDGKQTVSAIADCVSDEFEASKEEAVSDLCFFLNELERKQIIRLSDEPCA